MPRAKMLLVEDDAALAELLIWHFKREDFDVSHTVDGEEALLMAQETVPDIVLLDWMVESLSGIEVCRRLRRMTGTANVRMAGMASKNEKVTESSFFSPSSLPPRMVDPLRLTPGRIANA